MGGKQFSMGTCHKTILQCMQEISLDSGFCSTSCLETVFEHTKMHRLWLAFNLVPQSIANLPLGGRLPKKGSRGLFACLFLVWP